MSLSKPSAFLLSSFALYAFFPETHAAAVSFTVCAFHWLTHKKEKCIFSVHKSLIVCACYRAFTKSNTVNRKTCFLRQKGSKPGCCNNAKCFIKVLSLLFLLFRGPAVWYRYAEFVYCCMHTRDFALSHSE